MTLSVSQLKNELADREAIRDCLYRYARGIDRLDEDMMRSAYWPDAIDSHLSFTGTVQELITWGFPLMRAMDQNVHIIANVMIRLNGAKADVEAYFYGIQRAKLDGVMRDTLAAGRYLDKFERRGDEWRIANRIVMTDWFRPYPDSADWTNGPFGMGDVPRGKLKPDDESYTRFGWR
jgi:hypothetical protein